MMINPSGKSVNSYYLYDFESSLAKEPEVHTTSINFVMNDKSTVFILPVKISTIYGIYKLVLM